MITRKLAQKVSYAASGETNGKKEWKMSLLRRTREIKEEKKRKTDKTKQAKPILRRNMPRAA